mmetsp:Transcript_5118/g.7486  ORF Transcript_5118/g.7486 Transcript_5118/m.7486 type:complete len:227 (-) Transcript_5118:157-837(-)
MSMFGFVEQQMFKHHVPNILCIPHAHGWMIRIEHGRHHSHASHGRKERRSSGIHSGCCCHSRLSWHGRYTSCLGSCSCCPWRIWSIPCCRRRTIGRTRKFGLQSFFISCSSGFCSCRCRGRRNAGFEVIRIGFFLRIPSMSWRRWHARNVLIVIIIIGVLGRWRWNVSISISCGTGGSCSCHGTRCKQRILINASFGNSLSISCGCSSTSRNGRVRWLRKPGVHGV